MFNEIYYLIGILVVVVLALAYNLYQLWITPEQYQAKLINSVKDWWPFANFYRNWFASKAYIWLFRAIDTISLFIVLTILSLIMLGMMGLFP